DLDHFGIAAADMLDGPWYWFGRAVGASFVFLMGLSMMLAVARKPQAFPFYLKRAAGLMALGLGITVATAMALPDGTILFGILHLLAVMCLLLWWLRRLPVAALLALGVVMVTFGFWLNEVKLESPWLLWLGTLQHGRYMADWYPVLPWGGFGVLGVAAGKWLFDGQQPRFWQPLQWNGVFSRSLQLLGRHPLIIYLAHQPVLFALFWLAGYR
ncbi:MAG: heparan-alpha-glucosaminide N-acetyltransferase, partial [Gammaproteobacteria bacterium]|nr:heparan-alpha-glucosaminide N-acetyltransferase [Gammaproteobacteria bacterium]